METYERKVVLERMTWPENAPTPGCAGCNEPITGGRAATRVVMGPGTNTRDRDLCRAGKPHEAAWAWAHWPCATGDEAGTEWEVTRNDVLERVRRDGDAATLQCYACGGRIVGGSIALVTIGPDDGAENRALASVGRAHRVVAVPVHWACATGDMEPERSDCALCHGELGEDKACQTEGCDLNPKTRAG